MINFTKSQPAPACLAVEKAKNGEYKCGDVHTRLNDDFHRKCYICEDKDISNINVEHLIPHEGDIDLKFDWDNLCLSCPHCNNLKSNIHVNILNCVSNAIIITDAIQFQIDGFPKSEPKFEALLKNNVQVGNTINLLKAVYNGTTSQKQLESSNLRDKLGKEMKEFIDLLYEYFHTDGLEDSEKKSLKIDIKRKLSPESPFTAFKIGVIKSNDRLLSEFKDVLPVFK
jgi:HNH endonuclease